MQVTNACHKLGSRVISSVQCEESVEGPLRLVP